MRPLRRFRTALAAGVVAACLATGLVSAAAAGVVVIGHPDLATGEVAARDLERIFLGKMTRWSDGVTVVPVVLREGPTHEEFVTGLLGRSTHRFVAYWRQMVFTGKGTPPASVQSEREMVAYVGLTPEAVGYVSDAARLDGVRILVVDGP